MTVLKIYYIFVERRCASQLENKPKYPVLSYNAFPGLKSC